MKELKRGRYTLDQLKTFDIAVHIDNQKDLDKFQDFTNTRNNSEYDNLTKNDCFALTHNPQHPVIKLKVNTAKKDGIDVISFYQAFEIPSSPAMATKRKPNVKGHGFWG